MSSVNSQFLIFFPYAELSKCTILLSSGKEEEDLERNNGKKSLSRVLEKRVDNVLKLANKYW